MAWHVINSDIPKKNLDIKIEGKRIHIDNRQSGHKIAYKTVLVNIDPSTSHCLTHCYEPSHLLQNAEETFQKDVITLFRRT
uniref:Uncharacterized protein n=1 Tax=Timema bartmani TaxID=61472 RepID=A0A7R9I7G7_9NEOP|nr:unnamed protein product [Timema bartmani]